MARRRRHNTGMKPVNSDARSFLTGRKRTAKEELPKGARLCRLCGKTFTSANDLLDHRVREHPSLYSTD